MLPALNWLASGLRELGFPKSARKDTGMAVKIACASVAGSGSKPLRHGGIVVAGEGAVVKDSLSHNANLKSVSVVSSKSGLSKMSSLGLERGLPTITALVRKGLLFSYAPELLVR